MFRISAEFRETAIFLFFSFFDPTETETQHQERFDENFVRNVTQPRSSKTGIYSFGGQILISKLRQGRAGVVILLRFHTIMYHVQRLSSAQYRLPLQTSKILTRRKFSTKTKDTQQARNSSHTSENQAKEKAQRENIFNRFGAWYSCKLETNPLVTKSITGGLIAATGDTICQFGTYTPSEDKKEDGSEPDFWKEIYRPTRSFHFFLMGAFFASPLNHFWFNFLSRHFAGQSWIAITRRVFLDQFLWCPFWTVSWLSIFWTMEGTNPEDIPKGLKENYVGVLKANWCLWIPAQFITMGVIPLKYQVLFVNFVELVWNTYLSFAAAGKAHAEGASEEAISTEDDKKAEETQEKKEERRRTQTLHRRRTFH